MILEQILKNAQTQLLHIPAVIASLFVHSNKTFIDNEHNKIMNMNIDSLKQIALPSQAGLFYLILINLKTKNNETNEKIVNTCKKRCKKFIRKDNNYF